jgi:hypothetical protein
MPGDDEEADFIAEEILAGKNRPRPRVGGLRHPVPHQRPEPQARTRPARAQDPLPHGRRAEFLRPPRGPRRARLRPAARLPENDVPLLRILNAPNRGIGQSTAVLATDWSREKANPSGRRSAIPRVSPPPSARSPARHRGFRRPHLIREETASISPRKTPPMSSAACSRKSNTSPMDRARLQDRQRAPAARRGHQLPDRLPPRPHRQGQETPVFPRRQRPRLRPRGR